MKKSFFLFCTIFAVCMSGVALGIEKPEKIHEIQELGYVQKHLNVKANVEIQVKRVQKILLKTVKNQSLEEAKTKENEEEKLNKKQSNK